MSRPLSDIWYIEIRRSYDIIGPPDEVLSLGSITREGALQIHARIFMEMMSEGVEEGTISLYHNDQNIRDTAWDIEGELTDSTKKERMH